LKELHIIKQTAIINEDNLGAIFLTKNEQVSQRTKHIDIRQHFLSKLVAKKLLEVKFIKSENNTSDITSKNTQQFYMRNIQLTSSKVTVIAGRRRFRLTKLK
jgi:hypothetical protein